MNRTVGACGACGGRVAVPAAYRHEPPPVPACEACGRQAARPWGPVVEMTGLDDKGIAALEKDEAIRRRIFVGSLAQLAEEESPVHDNYREHGYFGVARADRQGQAGGEGGQGLDGGGGPGGEGA